MAVPVRDRAIVEVDARHVGTALRLGRLQHLQLDATGEAPAVGLALSALPHDSHAGDRSRSVPLA